MTQSEGVVADFLGAWRDADLENILGYFAEDAVYHNVPVAPIHGKAGIRQIFTAFVEAFAEADLEIINLGSNDQVVFAERVDHFLMHNGTRVSLPVTGVFEVVSGKIVRFSDYFDLADFERQSGLKL